VSWTVNQFFAVIFLVWLLVLFVQSLLGLFRVRLATAQLFGLIFSDLRSFVDTVCFTYQPPANSW